MTDFRLMIIILVFYIFQSIKNHIRDKKLDRILQIMLGGVDIYD